MVEKEIRKLSFNEIFSRQPNLDELKRLERLPIYVLAENIRSMHNVGSIFRTSDGVRIVHLYLTGFTAHPPKMEIEKTALGATDSIPWTYAKDPIPVLKKLKAQGVQIVAVEHTNQSLSFLQADYRFPVCLVVGNEVDGLSEEVIKMADLAVEIPMLGIKQSLNVSVAYGVVLYQVFGNYLKFNKFNLDKYSPNR